MVFITPVHHLFTHIHTKVVIELDVRTIYILFQECHNASRYSLVHIQARSLQTHTHLTLTRQVLQSTETSVQIKDKDMNALVDAGLLTFLGHCESRVASLLGKGFYTIGPCGEEVMGVLGAVLNKDDPMALHYRHVAASVRSLSLCLVLALSDPSVSRSPSPFVMFFACHRAISTK